MTSGAGFIAYRDLTEVWIPESPGRVDIPKLCSTISSVRKPERRERGLPSGPDRSTHHSRDQETGMGSGRRYGESEGNSERERNRESSD